MSYKLIVSIVPHDSGDFITDAANKAGAGGGTILMGRGTAANSVLQLLGLGDTSKDITINLVSADVSDKVISSIVEACQEKKTHFGVLFTLDASDFFKAGAKTSSNADTSTQTKSNQNKGDDAMANSYEMINIIVNKGYAEDAMAAARKAGAGGGTIINARGTAREGDAQFFGMNIVPEKEMLMILVPADKKDEIVKAVTDLPCFAEAGSGIVFCSNANDFNLLGKK